MKLTISDDYQYAIRDGRLTISTDRFSSWWKAIISFASKMVRHARKHYLKFCNNSPWFLTFKRVYTAFLC